MNNFRIGQKICCINTVPRYGYSQECMDGLTKGTVYTIRWIGIYWDEPCVRLEEIHRPPFEGWEADVPYAANRFRPVKTTSIDVFTAMLAPSPVKETV